jgi:hypothetical protein
MTATDADLSARIDVIERGYEYLLAYAAQGRQEERDARTARSAIGLALSRPAISSMLVDNLNASVHLRALLTDVFLLEQALKVSQP